jgi:hypothetical protein
MSKQPMSDRIADLREWIGSLPKYRDTAGAVRVLDEIAAAYADLLAVNADLLHALECLLTCSLPRDVSGRRFVDQARAAIARARGA